MPIIDFKEIPQANMADGNQDTFELFAREFFHILGFQIVEDPDRGQDGGRDLIISEKRKGIVGTTDFRWLVSCKHKAHSGAAVGVDDENDISDRIQAHLCKGFIGFYSTLPSAPLTRKMESLKVQYHYEIEIFDREKIERLLLENEKTHKLIERFFPKSSANDEGRTPSNILKQYTPLRCCVCGKDLLQKSILNGYQGIVVFANDKEYFENHNGVNRYMDIYCVCKGECDRKMEYAARKHGYSTGWRDISDLAISKEYLKQVMAIMNRMRDGRDIYTDEAYANLRQIMISIAQIVMKPMSGEDMARSDELAELPEGV